MRAPNGLIPDPTGSWDTYYINGHAGPRTALLDTIGSDLIAKDIRA